jgi:cytochrome d ubiquinol oxidase subunit II
VSYLVAAGLVLGLLAYSMFGGADFGAGFWDLAAGGGVKGRARRALIDRSVAPVWEANHTWLIYCLVVMWTAFPGPFAAIMTTLYLPLGIAALGIVLRGSGFAFRKVTTRSDRARLSSTVFATSSVITPFAFGTVAGALASGRVPAGGNGPPVSSWINPSSLFTGVLAVALCAYLAAVFLAADAEGVMNRELRDWFSHRAWVAAMVTGALSVSGLFVAHADAERLYARLLDVAWPFVLLSIGLGLAALLLLGRMSPRLVRYLSSGAVGALVVAWAVAQAPYLLGTHAAITVSAAPHATLVTLSAIFVAAAAVVVPSLTLLYVLQQQARLEGE